MKRLFYALCMLVVFQAAVLAIGESPAFPILMQATSCHKLGPWPIECDSIFNPSGEIQTIGQNVIAGRVDTDPNQDRGYWFQIGVFKYLETSSYCRELWLVTAFYSNEGELLSPEAPHAPSPKLLCKIGCTGNY